MKVWVCTVYYTRSRRNKFRSFTQQNLYTAPLLKKYQRGDLKFGALPIFLFRCISQISRQMSLGTNMKNQFWPGLSSRASTVKEKFGADYEQLLRAVFYVFMGKKFLNLF